MVTLSRDVVCEAGYNFLFQMVIQSFKKKKKKVQLSILSYFTPFVH